MSIYEELFRLRPIINAAGTMTVLGGSLMKPATVAAMSRAAEEWVDMADLLRLAGEAVDSALGLNPRLGGVHITAGASAANTLAAASVLTGHDRERMARLPDTSGFPNEILMQPTNAGKWTGSYRAAGAKIVECKAESVFDTAGSSRVLGVTEEAFEAAITENTCAIASILSWEVPHVGGLSIPQLVAIGKRHNLPVIVDAAAQVPPIDTLKNLLEMGVTLVAVSGGKAIGGPNDTGMIAGRKIDLTPAVLQSSPYVGMVGRGFKVSKEQIVGLVTAVQAYVEEDADALVAEHHRRCDYLIEQLAGTAGVRLEKVFPDETDLPVPRVRVHLTADAGKTVEEITDRLREETPSIRLRGGYVGAAFLNVDPSTLRDGEIEVVADRIGALLRE